MSEFKVTGVKTEEVDIIVDQSEIERIILNDSRMSVYVLFSAFRNAFLRSRGLETDTYLDKDGNWFQVDPSYFGPDRAVVVREATPQEIIAYECIDGYDHSRSALMLADKADK